MLNSLKQARLALFAIALLAVFLSPSPAKAQMCPPGSALEITQDLILGDITSILGALTGLAAFLMDPTPYAPGSLMSIQGAIAAMATAPAQANNVMTEAHMRINDALQNNEWSLSRSHAQGEAANDAQPSVTSGQSSTGIRRVFAVDTPKEVLVSNALAGEIPIASNVANSISQYGTFAEAAQQFQNSRIPNYANCKELVTSGGSCSNGPLPDGDVNAQSVFGYDTYNTNAQTQVNPSNTGSESQIQQAALDYCRSLITDLALDPNQNSLLASTQGMEEYALRRAGDAKLSLAQKVCYEISIERQPVPATSLPNDTLNWGIRILNNLQYPSSNIPQTLSPYQLMKILYSLQFADPNWMQLVSSDNQTQQMRLAVELHALRLQLQWENQKSLDEIKLMKAAEVAGKVQESRSNVPATALPAQ